MNESAELGSGNLFSTATSIQCLPQNSTWAFGWFFIPCFEVLLNCFLIFVTYRSKQKLRHNYVYAYVINVFTGNFLLGLFTMYSLLNYVLIIERYWDSDLPFRVDHDNPGHESLQLWWAFRRSFMVSLYLINNANVSALIYGIRDSAYFVGRNAAGEAKRAEKRTLRNRRNRAALIIAMCWLFPLGFSIAGLFSNCVEHCLCVYANYGPAVKYCQSDIYSHCSRIWQPLTDRFLLALAVAWCLEIVFIVTMLISALKRSISVMQPDTERPRNQSISSMLRNFRTTGSCLPVSTHERSRSKRLSSSEYFKNPTMKLLIAVSIAFFITSLPLMVVILIDVLSVEYVLLRYSVTAVLAISLLYGLVNPIILVWQMPNLRSAVSTWFLSMKCCTKSTVRVNKMETVS